MPPEKLTTVAYPLVFTTFVTVSGVCPSGSVSFVVTVTNRHAPHEPLAESSTALGGLFDGGGGGGGGGEGGGEH